MINQTHKYSEVTELIIKAFYNVYNKLGYGFLERVYENAISIELERFGLKFERQSPLKVYYDGYEIGEYFADIIVNDVVIVELKANETLHPENEAQLLNYLKATNLEVGLLLNFGKSPQIKRRVFLKEFKKS
ncbi:MAG: GxxExxY protein [Ignavibacteria bacterium]|nr:GxxExxY protein [Ignavibacteria bacterium]